MCIQNNNTRRTTSSTRRSSWSPSSLLSLDKVIKSLDITALKMEMNIIKEEMTQIVTATATATPTTTTARKITTKKRVQKSVRFQQEVAIQQVLHKNSYTEQELEKCWFTQNEYQNIRNGILMTLDLIRLGFFRENSIKNSSRGLEKYTAEGTMKATVQRRRQNAIWAVLDEQDLQLDRAEQLQHTYLIYNDSAIREVYKNQIRASADTSYSMGRLDAEAAAAVAETSSNKKKHLSSPAKKGFKNLFRKTEKRWSFTRNCSSNELSQLISLTA